MSNNQDFQPYTPRLGIAGSSYMLEMGKVNNFWAIRLVKSTDVLAIKVYKDEPNPEEIPLGNHLTGWVLSVLTIPNINTYQIQKTIGFLRQKALRTVEELKLNKQTAGKSERNDVRLEKIPENVQVKRPQTSGWVKEEEKPISKADQEVMAEFSPALAASNVVSKLKTSATVALGKRQLLEIPKGEGFIPQPFTKQEKKYVKNTGAITNVQNLDSQIEIKLNQQIKHFEQNLEESDLLQKIFSRIDKLEEKVRKLEDENLLLKNKQS